MYLGDRLLATSLSEGQQALVLYTIPDRLGTRILSASSADTTVTRQVTLPYGTVLNANTMPPGGRYFTSYDRSALTGLDYAVNRYYDPLQGRFVQADPLGMGAADLTNPQSLNTFSYVRNDPANLADPLGLAEPSEECSSSTSHGSGDFETVITCPRGWDEGGRWWLWWLTEPSLPYDAGYEDRDSSGGPSIGPATDATPTPTFKERIVASGTACLAVAAVTLQRYRRELLIGAQAAQGRTRFGPRVYQGPVFGRSIRQP